MTIGDIEEILSRLNHEFKRYDAVQDSYGNVFLTITLNNDDIVEMANPEFEQLMDVLMAGRLN